jgi:hypothetical protein
MHITTVFFFPFINLTYILSFPVLFAPRRKPSLSRVVIILYSLSRRFGINEADLHAFGKAAFERALKTHTLFGASCLSNSETSSRCWVSVSVGDSRCTSTEVLIVFCTSNNISCFPSGLNSYSLLYFNHHTLFSLSIPNSLVKYFSMIAQ